MPYKITDITIDKDKKGEIHDGPIKRRPRRVVAEPATEAQGGGPNIDNPEHHPMMNDNSEGMGKVKKVLLGILGLLAVVGLTVWTLNAEANIKVESQQAFIEAEDLPIQSSIAIPLNYIYATTTKVSSFKTVTTKASGKVTFYNEFSTSAQKLNVETKIKTASGLVYKTRAAVTVPGYKKSGTKIIPGTVQVSVDAEKAGSNYNVASGQKLTIGAYAGTTRGQKLYAKSNGITGGSSEKQPVFSDKVEKTAEEVALQAADANFVQTLRGVQDEPGIIIVYSSSTLGTRTVNTAAGTSGLGTTTVTISGTAYRIDQPQIVTALISKYRPKIKEQMADTADIDVNSLGADSIGGSGKVTIVNGTPVIDKGTWRIYTKLDADLIKKYIQGKNIQTALNNIKSNSHARAEISISPFWVRTIPTAMERINIEFKR